MHSLKTAPPIHPSAVRVTEIIDPASAGGSVQLIQQDLVKLSRHPLRAKRIEVRLCDCHVLFHATNLPVRTRTCLNAGYVAFSAFGPRSSGTVNGLQVSPDRILASKSGIEIEFIVAAGYESVAFLLPTEMIRDHIVRRQREDDFRIPQDASLLTPCPSEAHALYFWGRRLIDLAVRQPELFDSPQAQSAAQDELLEKLLTTLGSANPVAPSVHDLTQQRHSRVVQIAENYAMSHIAERLHVTDLCDATGVSERTLQYAFKELTGLTPIAYITQLRLHRARQALQAATHASTTVAKEALRWGFWHFGDFSRAYKECFGELPSQTLRYQTRTSKT